MWLFKGFLCATLIFVGAFLLSLLSEVAILAIVFVALVAIFSWWMYMRGGK